MERFILILFAVLLLFTGCSRADLYLKVTSGNFSFKQGEYEKSNINYLYALEEHTFANVIRYNLGNVYYAFSEPDAAREEWNKAFSAADDKLLFRIHFNRGVLNYDTGSYNAAYRDFKEALLISPGDLDAKVNLELSLQKMQGKGIVSMEDVNENDNQDDLNNNNEIQRILEFVKRKEAGWLATDGDQQDSVLQRDW